jgi:enoyl-[acyl-carrier protein] reductase I
VKNDFGSIDILVHSLANGPEVSLSLSSLKLLSYLHYEKHHIDIFLVSSTQKVVKPLLETSRKGYLAAISASSYSFVSLLQHFLPIMNPGNIPYLICCI